MIELAVVVFTLVGALAIVVYSTWLFKQRLSAGEAKFPAFKQWLKHLSEALFGL